MLACAERAEAYYREAKAGVRERTFALQLRGLGYKLTNDYASAIATYREAVELDRRIGQDTQDVAIDLNALAEVERMSGDLDAAERDYREALRIARAIMDHEGVASYTGNLAALALDREDWPSGEALARESLPLSEKVGRLELIGLDCRRLAKALARQGKKEEALLYARRAAEIYQKLGLPELADAQQTLAECESSEGGSD